MKLTRCTSPRQKFSLLFLFYSPKDTAKVATNPDAPKSVSGIQTHFARLLLYVSSCASNFISTSILSTFRWRLKEIGNKY